MASRATTTLIGLLVIVGMVAGCGPEGPASADAPGLREEVSALWREWEPLFMEAGRLRDATDVDTDEGQKAHDLCMEASSKLVTVGVTIGRMEQAIKGITDLNLNEAVRLRNLAREQPVVAREYLDRARRSVGEE